MHNQSEDAEPGELPLHSLELWRALPPIGLEHILEAALKSPLFNAEPLHELRRVHASRVEQLVAEVDR